MKKYNEVVTKVAYLLVLIVLLGSCSSTKNLLPEDQILTKVDYKLITDDKNVSKATIISELTTLTKQKPVKISFLNPRTWGKPLTIFDNLMTIESAESFEQYLRNRKGFYQAKVDYDIVEKGRKIELAYIVDLGKRSYVTAIKYSFEDSIMQRVLVEDDSDSEIQVGDPLEAKRFDREKVRIVNLMKNEGYANFNNNFIEYRGDSTAQGVDVTVYVYNPIGQDEHTKYKIGDINVYTEHSLTAQPRYVQTDTIDGNVYYSKTDEFLVNPKSIHDVISLHRGDLYNRNSENKTNQNLTALSPYRFAVVESYTENDSSDIYNYNIFLSPYQNKWVMDAGVNLFYSSISSSAGQNLFGLSGNLGFQNRNFKNRAIRHSIGLEGTLEFNIPDFPKLSGINTNTLSVQLSNKFDIPKVVDIFKVTNVLNWLNIVSDRSIENLSANGTTTFDISAGYTSIRRFYDLTNVNVNWIYNFQPNPRLRYTISQIGVNVIDTRINPIFQREILDGNPFLQRSFDTNLFTGFLFRELTMYRRTRETLGGSYFLMIGNFEVSGLENLLVNRLVNTVSGYNDTWSIGGLEFSEYIRFDADVRYYKKVLGRSNFAARLNAAIAVPYANDQSVPYIKQYFVGGPNSIRGWQLRELGPGTYSEENILNTAFYQTGDFKLEANVEYRFDLFWYLEGALFVDAGNVWLLKDDPDRPGAKLGTNFLDEMAIAAGWGIRLDFDYFIFRFDFGYKLRNPFPDPETGSQIVLTNGDYNGMLGNINFAINYPF